jgi:hypothetical protein
MKHQRVCAPVERRVRMSLISRSLIVIACAILIASHGTATAESMPKRGGTLVFAVDADPPNYDCHANFSLSLFIR